MIEYVDRKIVNGALLRNNNGRYVSLHVNVEEEANRSAKVIKGKTTDDMEVKINLNESLNVATKGWIEVIGMPIGSDTIQCKEIILFNQDDDQNEFDKTAHNHLVTFLNNCGEIFVRQDPIE